MSVNLTKPYAKSSLSVVTIDSSGSYGVHHFIINGHPSRTSTIQRVNDKLKNIIENGNKIMTTTVALITENLSEKYCKVFQPSEIEALKN